ncbi:NAD-dependent epimerase/dehydratase family protein [Luteimonas terricola]|uniref:Nucleoside-diphosphate sugar epimerase n=1 Tax=Luteimonas terricola TaxID=645597 RepID=A0ABQ2EA38_9GAMM|nr:NAD-dependent epimerase/dehydratase family protein [Luteimonas terricola]GGJ98404.1 nucleoside-diphosphate sugar epimerase [Luteimonas terricola]
MTATRSRALVFGGSGQVGAAVLARLLRAGWQVDALSRTAHAPRPGLRWLGGGFDAMPALASDYDAILSCGPLDRFAHWQSAAAVVAPRVVAFGSTSLAVKRGSADAGERGLAERLAASEQALFATARARGADAIVLRPTLVYGAGRDRTLSRIAAMARRRGLFVLPRGATGLRQPVHVDDLAATAIAALAAVGAGGTGYDLPGGETLAYRDMVARVLAVLEPPARLLEVPAPLFAALAAALRAAGRLEGFGAEAQARLRQDLVFDIAPAAAALGHAPRPFRPDATMFVPG